MPKFKISVIGCDDSTKFILELTRAESDIVKLVADTCTKVSTYGCMPKMEIKEVSDSYQLDDDE